MTELVRACAIALLLACAVVHAQQAPPPPPPPPPPAGPPSQPPAPAPVPANLSGRVVAADTGTPVRAADIRLAAADQNPNDRNTKGTVVARTDDEGRFELESLPAGSYSLQVAKAGFISTTFGLSKDRPGIFGLSAGQRVNLGDLKLPRGGVIAGRVFDALGDPVAEVVVTAERVSFLTPAVRRVIRLKSAQTNDLGDFRIHGLTPGKYYVSATRGGTESRGALTFFPGVSGISEATPIEVRAGQDSSGITMQLVPPQYGGVSGTVVNSKGTPFPAANVWLIPARDDGVQMLVGGSSVVTDAAGRFTINDVSPGDYRLEAFSRAWMEKYSAAGDSAGPPPELASVPISITNGRTEELSVRTSVGFHVRGQVLVDDVPLSAAIGAGVRVTARAPMRAFPTVTSIPVTDGVFPDGTFVLNGVHGLRLLTVTAPAGSPYHRVMLGGADISERGVEVTGDLTGVEIHLTTRPPRLEGTVVDSAGAPATDARILLFSTNRSDWLMPGARRYREMNVTGQGKFSTTTLPAGNYLAAIVLDEDSDRWNDPDFVDGLRSRATPFTLTDGSTTTVVLTVKR